MLRTQQDHCTSTSKSWQKGTFQERKCPSAQHSQESCINRSTLKPSMAPILPIIVSWLFFKMSQMIFPTERVQNGVLVLAKLLHPTRRLRPLQKQASKQANKQTNKQTKKQKQLYIVITLRTKGGSAWGKENSTPCGWFQNRTSRPAPGHARPTTSSIVDVQKAAQLAPCCMPGQYVPEMGIVYLKN